ncbi:hypothetical protein ABH940_002637 [Streptacidiphilus sp. BW17]
MAIGGPVSVGRNMARFLGFGLVMASVPLRAALWSGIPSNPRLRLVMALPGVRQRRSRARQRLLGRLDEVASMFSLEQLGLQEIDSAWRPSRLTLQPDYHQEALVCRLLVTGFFSSPVPYDELVPAIIDRVGIGDLKDKIRLGTARELSISEGAQLSLMESAMADPAGFHEGSLSLHTGRVDVLEGVDWQIPGVRDIRDPFNPKRITDVRTLRSRQRWTPSADEVQRARAQNATLIAWWVATHYYIRPKRVPFCTARTAAERPGGGGAFWGESLFADSDHHRRITRRRRAVHGSGSAPARCRTPGHRRCPSSVRTPRRGVRPPVQPAPGRPAGTQPLQGPGGHTRGSPDGDDDVSGRAR